MSQELQTDCKKFMPNRPKQETVTLVSLDLLRQTADYLRRLPLVPVTRDFIRQIDAHLSDPEVAAAKREAETAELLASRRTGGRYTPAGQPAILVVVEGTKATITVPVINLGPGIADTRMVQLAEGVTIDIAP